MKYTFPTTRAVVLVATCALASQAALAGQRGKSPVNPPTASTHFKASGPDFTSSSEEDELRTPLQFEQRAAETRIGPSNIFFYSRCRDFAGGTTLGPYAPFVFPEADAIVGDTQFHFGDGTACYNPQNESNVVVNPVNKLNIVTSANEYRIDGHAVYYSMDGGHSWSNVALPGWTYATGGNGAFKFLSSFGDPVLAFSADGSRLYYAGLVGGGPSGNTSGVAVAVSTDGGASWSRPHMVAVTSSFNIFNDKEWMTVAPDGTVYVTWTRFFFDPAHGYRQSPIVMSKSADGGRSWSAWTAVSDSGHPYDQGSNPVVAADGTLYVAYEGEVYASGYWQDATMVARSTNGGISFANQAVARVYDDNDCYPMQIGAQGRQTLSYEQFRINSFPNIALDRSTGKLAIVWADDREQSGCGQGGDSFESSQGPTKNQVFLVTSDDGLNWTTPTSLTSGDSYDKVYPSIAADNGRIVVGYYTRKYSPIPSYADLSCGRALLDDSTNPPTPIPFTFDGHPLAPVCLDYAVRSSDDDFATETRVSSQSSNPYALFAGSFIGDYTGIALDSSGDGIAVWTDSRGNPGVTDPNQDILVRTGF